MIHFDTKPKYLTAGSNSITRVCSEGEYLHGINVSELDSTLAETANDIVSAYIQDTSGQNVFFLLHGQIEAGGRSAWGSIKLQAGWQIKVRWWNATAGNIGFAYMAIGDEPLNLNWHETACYSSTMPAGLPEIVAVDGAATVTTQNLRPADHFLYRVIQAVCYHDDPANRTLAWEFYDGTNSVDLGTSAATIAANTPWSIGCAISTNEMVNLSQATPIILSYDTYARATAGALAAGKKLYIRALVQKIVGG